MTSLELKNISLFDSQSDWDRLVIVQKFRVSQITGMSMETIVRGRCELSQDLEKACKQLYAKQGGFPRFKKSRRIISSPSNKRAISLSSGKRVSTYSQ